MKYIEIAVQDSFDDNEDTIFDAMEKYAEVGESSPVSRGQLETLIERIANMTYDTQAADIIDLARVLNRQLKESQNAEPIQRR